MKDGFRNTVERLVAGKVHHKLRASKAIKGAGVQIQICANVGKQQVVSPLRSPNLDYTIRPHNVRTRRTLCNGKMENDTIPVLIVNTKVYIIRRYMYAYMQKEETR